MLFSTNIPDRVGKLGYPRCVELIAEAGFPALDFTFYFYAQNGLPKDAEQTVRACRVAADSHGAVFNQAHAPFGGGYDVYTSVHVPQMPEIFRLTRILGARQIVVHPLQRSYYVGHEKEIFEENVAFYRSLAPYARENGIRIAIENMWRRHGKSGAIVDDILASPAELCDLFDALDDSESFTVCLDIGHVTLCNHREPADAIRLLGRDRLGALHVHDTDYREDLHTLPFLGKIDWSSVTDALGEIGYEGELTLEANSFVKNTPQELIPCALRYMAETARYLAKQVELARRKV